MSSHGSQLPLSRAELVERWMAGERFQFYPFYGHKPPAKGVDDSCLSQWFDAGFTVDGQLYLTAEHWMMAEKARLFQDEEMLLQILESKTPRDAKALGRQVRGFDPAIWKEKCFDIVCRGNREKFRQNSELMRFLKATSANASWTDSAVAENPESYSSTSSGVAQAAEDEVVFKEILSHPAFSDADGQGAESSQGHSELGAKKILVEAAPRDRIWGIGLGVKNPLVHDPTKWRGNNLLGFALTSVRESI